MKAGALNSRIQFISYTQTSDGAGGSLPSSAQVIQTTNANVQPLKQDRTVEGNQQVLRGGYQIYIRYRRDFTPIKTYDIKYKDILITISSIQQSMEDRQMWLIIGLVK